MLRKFFSDKHGHIVITQKPNLPLVVWAVTALLAHIVPETALAHGFQVASRTALLIWAVEEIGWGDSYFRRLLGTLVLTWSVVALLW
jgi:hypothetical protein